MARSWVPALAPAAAEAPIFLRIARAVVDDVKRGRLARGAALPGSRELARALGVHRNTVLAAYRELAAEGWIASERARGTFVSASLPDLPARRFGGAPRTELPPRAGFDVARGPAWDDAPLPRGTLLLRAGIPDVRLVPSAALARAYRRALRLHGESALGYGDARGEPRLRAALSQMLRATRALACDEDDVLVTRGSQMALDCVARALLAPGDVVAVEALGYPPAWEALRATGARLVPIPVDRGGARVDAIAALPSLRAVYLTPHHQYPTTRALAPGRRLALLELARARRIAILEDDYDHEFHYDGRPVLPLASADRAGVVVYIGTLSKVLAPGLRIGYAVAPRAVVQAATARRAYVDRQGDHVLEHALAEIFEDGELLRHVRRTRRAYAERRAALADALTRALGDVLSFELPAGGTGLWCEVDPAIDVEAWHARSLEAGVSFQTARPFAFDGKARPFVRLGFARLDPRELAQAVRRITAALPARRRGTRASGASSQRP